ncbi:serine/threonine protein phosphatase [Thecamonas trahens ATCC 50062]|uniref:Serine/threonine-protein phosphatase n=1 Tax=Thecamonas trahens ATCC 50062 TaxID=461836 RepID=A0A0L0DVP5_THETB|nr:serine/threonine protein phosphatase [Thecamonas trahens ATCC 50062]KNC56295.1 serine/threonine protein phosphatase [Thecamonas trahens ATCC 50062]|eukprot:XP_013760814.1 serine/threonine protein phosphatase [Thecamonas trahens ATCC 50062]
MGNAQGHTPVSRRHGWEKLSADEAKDTARSHGRRSSRDKGEGKASKASKAGKRSQSSSGSDSGSDSRSDSGSDSGSDSDYESGTDYESGYEDSGLSFGSGSGSRSEASSREEPELSEGELRGMRAVFDAADRNGNGILEGAEVRALLTAMGGASSAADAQALLETVGKSKDDAISFDDFVAMHHAAQRMQLRELRDAYAVFDADGDGSVSVEELEAVLNKIGLEVEDKAAMLAVADVNHDGGITFPEFCTIMGYTGPMYELSDEEASDSGASTHNLFLLLKQRVDGHSSSESDSDSDSDSDSSESESETCTDSSGGSSSRSAGSSYSYSSRSSVPDGCIRVTVDAFYLDEYYEVTVKANATMKAFSTAVAEMAKHPSGSLLRFYYDGFHVPRSSKRLSSIGIDGSRPVFVLFLHDHNRLMHGKAFDADGRPRLRNIYTHFLREGKLRKADALTIVRQARAILKSEPNLLVLKEPVAIMGDIHGQYFDLQEMFKISGFPGTSKRQHLYLGDYVDRGYFSAEVALLLLAAKVRYPSRVWLLRGNHESRKTTRKYGSMAEITSKYQKKLYHELMKTFDALPLAALVRTGGHSLLAVHGGISPQVVKLRHIEGISRFREPPKSGPLKDTLWADPYRDLAASDDDQAESWDLTALSSARRKAPGGYRQSYFHSSSRGKNVHDFGKPAVDAFLRINSVTGIVRAHQQKKHGFEASAAGPDFDFPAVTTVFSAPNYTDTSLNDGAVVLAARGKIRIKRFKWRLHPHYNHFLPKLTPAERRAGYTKNGPNGSRDLDREDFVQFLNWINPSALRKLTILVLEKEFREAFLTDQVDRTSGRSRVKQAWLRLRASLVDIMRLSSSAAVQARIKSKTRAIVQWYDGINIFKQAVEDEQDFEQDFDDDAEADDVDAGVVSSSSDDVDVSSLMRLLDDDLEDGKDVNHVSDNGSDSDDDELLSNAFLRALRRTRGADGGGKGKRGKSKSKSKSKSKRKRKSQHG